MTVFDKHNQSVNPLLHDVCWFLKFLWGYLLLKKIIYLLWIYKFILKNDHELHTRNLNVKYSFSIMFYLLPFLNQHIFVAKFLTQSVYQFDQYHMIFSNIYVVKCWSLFISTQTSHDVNSIHTDKMYLWSSLCFLCL